MTIQEYVERGRAAVEAIQDYDQAQTDKLVYEAAKIIYQHAAELAREAVDETGLGYYEDKIGQEHRHARCFLGLPERQEVRGHHQREQGDRHHRGGSPCGRHRPASTPPPTPTSRLLATSWTL